MPVSFQSENALGLYSESYAGLMKMEGRLEFVKRMREKIMGKIKSKENQVQESYK